MNKSFDAEQSVTIRIDPMNRWIQKSKSIPWDEIEKKYAKRFKNRIVDESKTLRVALSACIIQREYGYSDQETVLQIQENPYLQFFCGFDHYENEQPFDPSLMAYFRNRLPAGLMDEINELIAQCTRKSCDDSISNAVNTKSEPKKTKIKTKDIEDQGFYDQKNSKELTTDATYAPQPVVGETAKALTEFSVELEPHGAEDSLAEEQFDHKQDYNDISCHFEEESRLSLTDPQKKTEPITSILLLYLKKIPCAITAWFSFIFIGLKKIFTHFRKLLNISFNRFIQVFRDKAKVKTARKILLAFCSLLLTFVLVLSLSVYGLPDRASLLNILRGNDPLLQEVIPLQEAAEVETFSDYDLEDDKSLYNLEQAGEVTVFLLEVYEKNGYDLTDFEDPETAADLKLPVILREGTSNGTVLFGGFGSSAASANATLEVKGEPKENRKYHNFRIRLQNSASRYNGQSILNLKKAYGKPCKVEEKFSFDLFAGLEEMMSLQTKFVHLYIKNNASPSPSYESYGLYILVEQPDENYFINRSLDESANMYQAENFDFTLNDALVNVDDASYDKNEFEAVLDIKQGESHTSLLEMIRAVNDESQDIDDVIDQYLNRDNLFSFMAMNVILGNEDLATKGFLLYKPLLSSVWFVLPSNMSETMLSALDETHYQVMNTGVAQFSGNLLYERILSKPENVEELCEKIDAMLARVDQKTVTALTNQYIPVLAEYLVVNPDRGILKSTPEEIIAGVQNYYNVMCRNVAEFKENLYTPEKVVLGTVENTEDGFFLNWQEPAAVLTSDVKYTIEIAVDSEFTQVVFQADSIESTSYDVSRAILPDAADYFYWRVTVVNASGHSSGSANTLTLEDESTIYGASGFAAII